MDELVHEEKKKVLWFLFGVFDHRFEGSWSFSERQVFEYFGKCLPILFFLIWIIFFFFIIFFFMFFFVIVGLFVFVKFVITVTPF
jgi:hypothetical protein